MEEEFSTEVMISDTYVEELLADSVDSKGALEYHLDNKPKNLTVSFDNLDGNAKSCDFIMGDERDNSYHWCSSVIFEDVVTANQLSDSQAQPSILEVPADVRMCLTGDENEHLLQSYIHFVMYLVKNNWPNLFPEMKASANYEHQYSEQFEQGVPCWVGPLVCEDESSITGISKVLKELIDTVCPKTQSLSGRDVPVHPTVFSGDNKEGFNRKDYETYNRVEELRVLN